MDALHCSSSASSDTGSSPMKCGKLIPKGFWFSEVRETLFSSGRDGLLHVTILGGSEHDSFCYISDADEERLNLHSGRLHRDDIILEIQGENVAGFTRQDLLDWLWSVSRNHSPVLMKTVSSGELQVELLISISKVSFITCVYVCVSVRMCVCVCACVCMCVHQKLNMMLHYDYRLPGFGLVNFLWFIKK